MNDTRSLQETYAPNNRCFGCGPANEQGLRIRSFVEGDEVVARWSPQPHHQAFPGMLNGGICGALLDCHGNWTAAHRLMAERGAETPPCTVTARYAIELKRPTPLDTELVLRAARECGAILTVEEHQVNGGLGSAVAEVVVQNHPVPMRLHGIHGEFGQSATAGELLAHYRLDAAGIAAEAKDLMGRKG